MEPLCKARQVRSKRCPNDWDAQPTVAAHLHGLTTPSLLLSLLLPFLCRCCCCCCRFYSCHGIDCDDHFCSLPWPTAASHLHTASMRPKDNVDDDDSDGDYDGSVQMSAQICQGKSNQQPATSNRRSTLRRSIILLLSECLRLPQQQQYSISCQKYVTVTVISDEICLIAFFAI